MSNMPEAPTYRSGTKSVAPVSDSTPQSARAHALEFLTQLARQVSSGTVDLPCFPDVVLRVRNELANPKTTPERTVIVVGAEPRLAARLLQTANSAAFNQSGKPVTDLRTAITRLGHQLVQSAAMSYAVQQIKSEQSLRAISKPLTELWKDSIAVAAICQVLARRTRVSPDEAFLTGLLHGIGRLYVMVRAAAKSAQVGDHASFTDLVSSWQASIGKAILSNWRFAAEICEAVGDQDQLDRDRRRRQEADLTDILIAGVLLANELKRPAPRRIAVQGVAAYAALALSAEECAAIVNHAERHFALLHETLGC
ncbi:MAG TPA: HDOD domain-containing protein [Steroidobacteraceae bacterium]|nr:HDOD domain-containing protein [Steroidobacteraceae bacterium]